MAILRAIGLPENDSEREALAFFRDNLPSNDYIIFHNLEIHSKNVPYEFDLVIVGERAIYPIELKGYGGQISGNAAEWELASGAIIKSPLPLAAKKAKVLASSMRRSDPGLDHVFVEPTLVVLTDPNARIDLDDPERVMSLAQAVQFIKTDGRDTIIYLHERIVNALARQFQPLRRINEIGDYLVREIISKNELYTTYLAEHRLLGAAQRFALKVYNFDLYADSTEQARQKEFLLRDANALYRLTGHPNIVRAHPPFPWQSNQIVLPLDWVEGFSLRGLMNSKKPLAFSSRLRIARQICKGLAYAHAHGVIHRDLRPANVIVSRKGIVQLINFDCARVEADDMHTIASRVGRHLAEQYVAPEVWRDASSASRASDLYSVGILLFELLAGKHPYERITQLFPTQGLKQKPSQVNPQLPAAFDELIASFCAFDVKTRNKTLDNALAVLDSMS